MGKLRGEHSKYLMLNFPLFHLVQKEQHLYQVALLPFPVRLVRERKQPGFK